MKRRKYYLLILCAGAFAACTDLDIPPKNIFNEQDIFGNVEGATSYLARLYGVLPMEDFRYSFEHGFGYSGAMYRQMCCATGEAVGRDTQGFFAEPGSNMWDAAYKMIREINLLIEGLPKYKSGFSDSDYNTVLGEAYFIRAYVYFAMVKRLGGVPKIDYVIDYPANATLEDTWTPRASEEECWDFIGQDLDAAIASLPDKNASGLPPLHAEQDQQGDRQKQRPMAEAQVTGLRRAFITQRHQPKQEPASVSQQQEEFQLEIAGNGSEAEQQQEYRSEGQIRRNHLDAAPSHQPRFVGFVRGGVPAGTGCRIEAVPRNDMDEKRRGKQRPRRNKPSVHTHYILR